MRRRPLRIIVKYAEEPMTPEQWEAAERLLAKLVAKAYLKDLEEKRLQSEADPTSAADADVSVLGADAGDPTDAGSR